MSKVFIEESTLTAIGDAIRDKEGSTDLIAPLDMASKITNLPSGGEELPEEAFNLTGNCVYRFAYNGWNWFINKYGNRITTKDISNPSSMFYSSDQLKEIPFDINLWKTSTSLNPLSNMFYSCRKLEKAPYVIDGERKFNSSSSKVDLSSLFSNCNNLREIPYDFFWKYIPNADYWEGQTNTTLSYAYGSRDNLFAYCYSLRKHPDISMLAATQTSTYGCIYYYTFHNCYALDEIENLPVMTTTLTSNTFSSSNTFSACARVKGITFVVNADGTPKTANWKSQTIDLRSGVGFYTSASVFLNHNSGITADKQVKDDATYQALKDDPDWFTTNADYCRYNHDSAVATINSLPDTSAYLASAGGSNTITFKGTAGALTDGGAINTMTEEEIAIATAKGWTVTFV